MRLLRHPFKWEATFLIVEAPCETNFPNRLINYLLRRACSVMVIGIQSGIGLLTSTSDRMFRSLRTTNLVKGINTFFYGRG